MTLEIMKQAYNDGKKNTRIQYASSDLMNQILAQLQTDLGWQMMDYIQTQSGKQPKLWSEYQSASCVVSVYWE